MAVQLPSKTLRNINLPIIKLNECISCDHVTKAFVKIYSYTCKDCLSY